MNIMIYIGTVQHGQSNSVEATIFSFASRYVVCSKITISSRNAQNISQVSHQHRDNPEPPPRLGQGARYPENIWTHLQFVLKSLKETHISKVNSSEISIKNYNKSITKLEEKVKVHQEETSTLPSTITLLKSDATSPTLLAGVSESEKLCCVLLMMIWRIYTWCTKCKRSFVIDILGPLNTLLSNIKSSSVKIAQHNTIHDQIFCTI